MRLGNILDKILSWVVYDFIYLFFPPYKRKKLTLMSCSRLLGDVLLVTATAREIKKRNPKAFICVESVMPEIFSSNPDIDKFVLRRRKTNYFQRLFFMVRNGYGFPWKRHLLYYCCKAYGIRKEIEYKTYVYPSDLDVEWAKETIINVKNKIIFVSRESGPSAYQHKKAWPAEYWESLIGKLLEHFTVFDIGLSSEHRLNFQSPNWLDLIGQTTVLQLAALMRYGNLLVAPPSGLIHLAAYCDLKTLCIVGGSEPGIATQYPKGDYVDNRPVCKDCFFGPPCDRNMECLRNITVDVVLQKILSKI